MARAIPFDAEKRNEAEEQKAQRESLSDAKVGSMYPTIFSHLTCIQAELARATTALPTLEEQVAFLLRGEQADITISGSNVVETLC